MAIVPGIIVGLCTQRAWLNEEELARWLVDQHRPEDAQTLTDAARANYTNIGATGWLAKLDAWDTNRQPSRTP